MTAVSPAATETLAQALAACWRGRWLDSPQVFYGAAGPLARLCGWVAIAAGAVGLTCALLVAGSAAAPGEAWRIVFVHVPAAWMSLLLYLVLAAFSALSLLGRVRLAAVMSAALLPSGALMSLLTIWTGALWGRPTSGAWWTWDPRLAAELGLLAAYLICTTLPWLVDEPRRAERATAMLALAGVANVALVHRSAHWWQAAPSDGLSMSLHAPPATPTSVVAMALMGLAFAGWAAAAVLQRARVIVLERERRSPWAQALPEAAP